MDRFSIGVDLGGTNMRIAAVDESGRRLETISTSTQVTRGRALVIDDMCASIRELTGRSKDARVLAGVGIGVPGVIDMDSGTVCAAANLPGWTNYPVRSEIEQRLGAPVVLENDANCAALGEQWLGAGRDANSLCMLTLGTGVGGASIFNGNLWHGAMGMAGEVGHMTVTPDGPECNCGNSGCLERFASATAIKQMAVDDVAAGKAPELARALQANPEISAEVVFQYAMQGDAAARHIFERVGSALGVVLAGLVDALNLPMYVIGGGVSNSWDAFAPAMFRELTRRSIVFRAGESQENPKRKTVVARAILGGDAGLLGAAKLGWKS